MATASSFTNVSVILNMSEDEAYALNLFLEQQTPHAAMTATQTGFIVNIYHALKKAGVKSDDNSNDR